MQDLRALKELLCFDDTYPESVDATIGRVSIGFRVEG